MMQNPSGRYWLICQLADSAFPTGGFAHSSGLEAAWQLGFVGAGSSLESYLRTQLRQTSHFGSPFVIAAYRAPQRLVEYDSLCDALLSNHVARRASRAQGQALLMAASRAFPLDGMASICKQVRDERLRGHFAPVFGACAACLGLDETETARLFLFLVLRGLISASVRLGIVGPLEAQALQWHLSREAESCMIASLNVTVDAAGQTAPLLDLLQGMQDRLYSRLFQS